MTLLAKTQEKKKFLLEWKSKKVENLKDHELSIGQQWRAVTKAFTIEGLSTEEKEKIFAEQLAIDSSDTSKLKRETCNSLKANKEEFEKIYESFKDPKSELSTSMKSARASGWNDSSHKEWLKEYRARYFKDIPELSKVLVGDHLELFVMNLAPQDDDLESQIAEYQKIKLDGQKFDKINIEIRKIVDDLQRRNAAYKLFYAENK